MSGFAAHMQNLLRTNFFSFSSASSNSPAEAEVMAGVNGGPQRRLEDAKGSAGGGEDLSSEKFRVGRLDFRD